MKPEHIIRALSAVEDEYIREAAPEGKKRRKTHIPWVAAAMVVLTVLVFCRTAPGVRAIETVKQAVTDYIRRTYPPKEVSVELEGMTEVETHTPGGQEPEVQEDGTLTVPGFVIYYDPELYTMTTEGERTFLRFEGDGTLPPCEMEIRYLPGQATTQAAQAARTEMEETLASTDAARQALKEGWEMVSEITILAGKEGVSFSYYQGLDWNSPCGTEYFLSDGHDGCFHISARYFVEAAEGHGARFGQMVYSFEVVDP